MNWNFKSYFSCMLEGSFAGGRNQEYPEKNMNLTNFITLNCIEFISSKVGIKLVSSDRN